MKILRLLFLSMFVSSCTGVRPESPGIDFSDFPDHWPSPIEDREFLAEECPKINDLFSSGGQSSSDISERFSNPIFERNSFGRNEIAKKTNSFDVRSDASSKRLNFEIFSLNGDLLATGLSKQFDRCENGWFVQETFSKGGTGDNPVKSTFSTMAYGLAKDGSLLIHSYQEVVSGKMIVGRETNRSSIWYRYKKIN